MAISSVQKSCRNWQRHSALALYKGKFASSFRGVLLPQSPWYLFGNNFSICTKTNYFTKSNLSVSLTVSQRHRHLSEEIFYDSLGIGIQIRGGAKSAPRCPRIWLQTFDVIILEAIALHVQSKWRDPNPRRGSSKSASVFGWGIQIRGDPNPRFHLHDAHRLVDDRSAHMIMLKMWIHDQNLTSTICLLALFLLNWWLVHCGV